VNRLVASLVTVAVALATPLLGPLAPASADASGSSGTTANPLSDAERAKKALRVARRQIGDAYKYGAEGPDRFDCSGLVYFATHKAGFTDVPRTSGEQADHMRRIKRSKLRRGDFVFFTSKGDVYHVGFYVGRDDGDRMVLHAPSTGKDVQRDPIWTDKWFAGTLRGA
jgi:cell wall-associated NlpC family hydrolase